MSIYLFLTVIESAINDKPEKIAKGIALAIKNSGTKFENIVLKNKKVESNAINTRNPMKTKGSFFVILTISFVNHLPVAVILPFHYNDIIKTPSSLFRDESVKISPAVPPGLGW